MDNTLEYEQLEKRVEWLDNERRTDKTIIASLQSKLENLDDENSALRGRITEMESEITRLTTLMTRVEQFELEINAIRTESSQGIKTVQESLRDEGLQTEKNRQELASLKDSITDLRKKTEPIEETQEALAERKQEDFRLARQIETLKAQILEVDRFDEEYKRSLRLIEENRRQDSKRLTDVQGELAALRKRQEEIRGKQDLAGDNVRKLENRIKDLLAAESERREAQTAFIEKVNLAQVERDRTFREWQDRFEAIEKITTGLEKQLTELENTHRSVKKSQAALDEVTQRFDRRVNEITEVQRLNEDRFRQEWTTFKSDDQKRWSNYTLAQEEQHREMNREIDTLNDRIAQLEDLLQDLQDNLQQLGREDINRMQTMLNKLRESIETYNDIFNE
jgi:chromosome segregation ATPase